jgi:hypothetical protein
MYGRDRLPYPCLYPPFYRLQGRTSTTTNLFGNWTSFEKKGKRKFAVISAGKVEFSGDGHDRRRRDRRGERKPRTCLVRWPLELEMDQNDSLYSTKESMFQQSILVSVLLHQLYSISANSLMRWSLIIKKKRRKGMAVACCSVLVRIRNNLAVVRPCWIGLVVHRSRPQTTHASRWYHKKHESVASSRSLGVRTISTTISSKTKNKKKL